MFYCRVSEHDQQSYRNLYRFFVGTIAITITISKTIPITKTTTIAITITLS